MSTTDAVERAAGRLAEKLTPYLAVGFGSDPDPAWVQQSMKDEVSYRDILVKRAATTLSSDLGFRAAVEHIEVTAEYDRCPECIKILALLVDGEQKDE